MWIVRLALQRTLHVCRVGGFDRAPRHVHDFSHTDGHHPKHQNPVVAVIWSYGGLPPEEMASRIVLLSDERPRRTVNDVEHTESQSLNGISVVKYFFQPTVDEELAYAQITGISQTILRATPPGTTPPFILAYNALQRSHYPTCPFEQDAFGSANLRYRQQCHPHCALYGAGRRASLPLWRQAAPNSGRPRSASLAGERSLRHRRHRRDRRAKSHSAGGHAKRSVTSNTSCGSTPVRAKSTTSTVFRSAPAATEASSTCATLRMCATALLSNQYCSPRRPPRSTYERPQDGGAHRPSQSSTAFAKKLPQIRAALPPDLDIKALGDQSVFVRGAISGVIREGTIAAALTGLIDPSGFSAVGAAR